MQAKVALVEKNANHESPESDKTGSSMGDNEPLPHDSLRYRLVGTVVLISLLIALYTVVQLIPSSREGDVPLAISPSETISSHDVLQEGDLAPDFEIPTLDGSTFLLSRHLAEDGRPVFINMWAEWCYPCRAEMATIDALSRSHSDIHFIGVAIKDSETSVRHFVEEFNITYQIGLDTKQTVEDIYAVWAMPTTYLVDTNGVIVSRFFGQMTEKEMLESINNLSTS